MIYDVTIETKDRRIECRHECDGDETECLRQVCQKYQVSDAKFQNAIARPDIEDVSETAIEAVETPIAATPEVIAANDDYIARVIEGNEPPSQTEPIAAAEESTAELTAEFGAPPEPISQTTEGQAFESHATAPPTSEPPASEQATASGGDAGATTAPPPA